MDENVLLNELGAQSVEVSEPRPGVRIERLDEASTEVRNSGGTRVTVERDGQVIAQQSYDDEHQIQASGGHGKVGRNDPCWCGSGKKYKKCHYPN